MYGCSMFNRIRVQNVIEQINTDLNNGLEELRAEAVAIKVRGDVVRDVASLMKIQIGCFEDGTSAVQL